MCVLNYYFYVCSLGNYTIVPSFPISLEHDPIGMIIISTSFVCSTGLGYGWVLDSWSLSARGLRRIDTPVRLTRTRHLEPETRIVSC